MEDDEPEVDIAALLAMTFEAKPSDEMAERVASRIALLTTVSEWIRMIGDAPWHWVGDVETSLVDPKEDEE